MLAVAVSVQMVMCNLFSQLSNLKTNKGKLAWKSFKQNQNTQVVKKATSNIGSQWGRTENKIEYIVELNKLQFSAHHHRI